MRVFVALDIPPGCKQALEQAQQRLLDSQIGGRLAPAQGMHITLRFLGEQDEENTQIICNVTQRLFDGQVAPLVQVDGVGAFIRSTGDTVYAKLAGDVEGLLDLYDALSHTLKQTMGIGLEMRPFTPHITLIRGANYSAATERVLFHTQPFYIPSVTVYQSILSPQGATYQPLCKVPLLR
ncbi:RNA 2',3'-cyclic phosphodiesterase [Eubacteriales bacterium OttesenSCG-928-N14]|nr:RNA 2',3'-cyclic phosphodiesterase [Eubacteriales bacterium OttesenSCG-928-N14]